MRQHARTLAHPLLVSNVTPALQDEVVELKEEGNHQTRFQVRRGASPQLNWFQNKHLLLGNIHCSLLQVVFAKGKREVRLLRCERRNHQTVD